MYHPKTIEWDARMKEMFDRIDTILEERHGGAWKLRRNRPALGETANPEADGLFNLGVFFDPGFGSRLGRGYLVEIDLAAGEEIPPAAREAIELEVLELLRRFLPEHFPERRLEVDREGRLYKIHGDLSLGEL
ncbi:MAG: hypothetical protein JNG85_11520 [Spirochaetaceae bacterium]|nr:hypothetical protein [Spirochaetaceae bacterium]